MNKMSNTMISPSHLNAAKPINTDTGENENIPLDADLDEDFLRLDDESEDREDCLSPDDIPSATDFYTTRTKSSKYPNWPMINIKDVHENDVLFGRGGGTNHHPGNKRFRQMVEELKVQYVNSNRKEKPLVALKIVGEWRAQEPPGRFLMHNDVTRLWHDVGDKKAREKTSQALREKAPQIRKQQEEEVEKDNGCSDEVSTKAIKSDLPKRSKGPSKGKLKRIVHSLGFECDPTDLPDLRNFSWDKGDDIVKGHQTTTTDLAPSIHSVPSTEPHFTDSSSLFSSDHVERYPMSRENSLNGYPPPPIAYHIQNTAEHHRPYYHYPPPWDGQYPIHPSSIPPPTDLYRSDSHNSSSSMRNSHLWETDAIRDISQDWMTRGHHAHSHVGPLDYQSNFPYGSSLPEPLMNSHTRNESTNSTGSLVWLHDKRSPNRRIIQDPIPISTESPRALENSQVKMIARNSTDYTYSMLPKPAIVKRETSHVNENAETKPHRDKRPVMKKLQSRGSSIGSLNVGEVDDLGNTLEQSTLVDSSDSSFDGPTKPPCLADKGRMTTATAVQLEFMNEITVARDFERPWSIEPDERLISVKNLDLILLDENQSSDIISKRSSPIEVNQRMNSDVSEIINSLLHQEG